MDPSKSASAPPAGWSDEKSSMAHAPPPPYSDQQYPGYPQPGPGYPQPGPGYPPQQQYQPVIISYHGYVPPPQYGGVPYGQQPGQLTPVTVQPTVFVTQGPLTNPANDYLCYSIFTMLCCCLPLGIAALIYSISTREANHVGDRMGAERSSRMARTLNHVALGIGIGFLILSIVYVVVMSSVLS